MCSGSSTAPTGTTMYGKSPYLSQFSFYPNSRWRGLTTTATAAEPASPYASNYGYGTTAPTYSEAERQWYMQNGYGDPLTMTNGYYQGVTQDARAAYLSAADYANQVAAASKQYSSGMSQPADSRTGYGVTYTYAGDALGIPK